jgi:transmembrane sensor
MRDNVIDFIDREAVEAQAREWLVRLDGDSPLTPAEREALQRWAAQSPAHRQELLRIAAFWSEADLLAELATPQRRPHARWELGLARIWQVVCATPRAAIAATLVLVIAAALLAPRLLGSNIEASNGLYATSVGEQREQVLSDGSVVEINTNSEVQVAYSKDRRLVRLVRGEAHFKVAHDARRPFDVYAGTSLIRATGTAFSVHMQGSDVTVTVAEGSVALGTLPAQPKESDVAAPLVTRRVAVPMLRQIESGHSARLHENIAEVRTLATEDLARELAWREGLLVFTDEPLSQVIDEVSRYTSVRIEIADARLRALPVGGRFKLGDLDAMLDALESSFGIRVLRLDDEHIQLLAAPPEQI